MTIVNECQYMKFNQSYKYFDALLQRKSDHLFPRMLKNI